MTLKFTTSYYPRQAPKAHSHEFALTKRLLMGRPNVPQNRLLPRT